MSESKMRVDAMAGFAARESAAGKLRLAYFRPIYDVVTGLVEVAVPPGRIRAAA